ncbi:hypothetical protein EDC04DRAFT_2727207 [Pisolithus marmoratus]|nr:hypothetical protein EDC04DRAFT_2727207 [Pisolithus marmoratus]
MASGCFSALWCFQRRPRARSEDTVVPQVVPRSPTEATQTNDGDVRVAPLIHVPSPTNMDVLVPAPTQGSVPSSATPQAVPTGVQSTMPEGPATAGNVGIPTLGDTGFNPGRVPPGAFSGPQSNRVADSADMMPPPEMQLEDNNKPSGTRRSLSPPDGSTQNHLSNSIQPGGQGSSNVSNSQGNTVPSTPSATSSTIAVSSPSAVNGTPTLKPTAQPTSSMSEPPESFLTAEFMQLVTTSLDEFDPRALFRPGEAGIDFEQSRDWFRPEEKTNGTRNG